MKRSGAIVALVLLGGSAGVLAGIRLVSNSVSTSGSPTHQIAPDLTQAPAASPGPKGSGVPPATPSPSTPSNQALTTEPGPGAQPAGQTPSPNGPTPSPPEPAGPNADPEAVARNFILGYATFNWFDQPTPKDGQLARARPWTTAAFQGFLVGGSSAQYLTSQKLSAHQVDTAQVVRCDPVDPASPTIRTYQCLTIVTTSKDGAAPVPRGPFYQVTLVSKDGAWFVDRLEV